MVEEEVEWKRETVKSKAMEAAVPPGDGCVRRWHREWWQGGTQGLGKRIGERKEEVETSFFPFYVRFYLSGCNSAHNHFDHRSSYRKMVFNGNLNF